MKTIFLCIAFILFFTFSVYSNSSEQILENYQKFEMSIPILEKLSDKNPYWECSFYENENLTVLLPEEIGLYRMVIIHEFDQYWEIHIPNLIKFKCEKNFGFTGVYLNNTKTSFVKKRDLYLNNEDIHIINNFANNLLGGRLFIIAK